MKNNLSLTLSLILTSLLIFSCAKDGAIGPQGPAGKNGNANVISKAPSIVSFTYVAGKNAYDATIKCPEITQDIVDKGAVMCYEKVAQDQWMPWNANIGTTYYIYNIKLGEVILEYRNTAGTTTNEGNKEMRLVIIPSNQVQKLPSDLSEITSLYKTYNR
jgi:hypothetical protein